MKVHVADTIRGWLGWCPNAPARIQKVASDATGTPSGSGLSKEKAFRWLGLFRNQMLLLAIWFSFVGYLLLITIGDNNLMLFIWGLLAGLGLCFHRVPVLGDNERSSGERGGFSCDPV